jgi:negative regulator of flagellin synthesis FlgM
MNNIDTRSPFFPRTRSSGAESLKDPSQVAELKKNSEARTEELINKTSQDAKVSIPDGVKDFSRIKKAALTSPETDNSEKIAKLKAQIEAGTYEVDYDALADNILMSEF